MRKKFLVVVLSVLSLTAWEVVPPSKIAGGAGGSLLPPGTDVSWGLRAIRAPEAWQITQGSEEIVVAVIDSGIDRRVSALAGRMWQNPNEVPGNGLDDDRNGYVDDVYGWDFRDGDPDSLSGTPLYWHGTFVASLVAAAFDARSGAGGVAPEIRVMDLRFLDSKGLFYQSDWRRLAQAIDYAVAEGANIINLSLYAKQRPPDCVHQAIRRAAERGVLVVTITGNDAQGVQYLARYPEVVAVGAVDQEGRPASFSGRGPEVDLVAPGVQVVSFGPNGVSFGSGTSFAAPHVAGTAALLLALDPGLSPEELLTLLREAASDLGPVGWDLAAGAGLVDAATALATLAGDR